MCLAAGYFAIVPRAQANFGTGTPPCHVSAMNNAEFQLRAVGDPRLAAHATSALPAWLWSIDGTRVLWANAVGAKLFGAANGAALTTKLFGPAETHRRQVAQLARHLSQTHGTNAVQVGGRAA